MSTICSNTNTIIPSTALKYRFFNQPIEQIPGFDITKPQILAHAPNCGLMWFTIDQCLEVVTCLSLQTDKLKVTRNNVVVIKDFGILAGDTACDIPLTNCPTNSPSP